MSKNYHCETCGNRYPAARARLGYTECVNCGELTAQQERKRRSKCIAPAYNKGAYQYVATREQAKHVGKK